MTDSLGPVITTIGIVLLCVAGVAILGLALLVRAIRRLNIPPDADFFTTMRHIPLVLVILLDLLDLGLDFFATPIVWIFLDRMHLHNLRNKALIEAVIPFSGPIPTFTIAWVAARTLNLGEGDLRVLRRVSGQQPTMIDVDAR